MRESRPYRQTEHIYTILTRHKVVRNLLQPKFTMQGEVPVEAGVQGESWYCLGATLPQYSHILPFHQIIIGCILSQICREDMEVRTYGKLTLVIT